jgi:hypothetical protein
MTWDAASACSSLKLTFQNTEEVCGIAKLTGMRVINLSKQRKSMI